MPGARIRYYRKRNNLTQGQLAQGICSVSYLSKFENGAGASEEIIRLLCQRLDISYEIVDNQEEIEHGRKLLDEWYEEIKKRDYDQVEKQKPTLESLIPPLEMPDLSVRFDLFKLRYFIIIDIEQAGFLLDQITDIKNDLNKESLYFYYHFSGLYYSSIGKYEESLNQLKKAEKTGETIFSEAEIAELYYQIGRTYTLMHLNTISMNYINSALEIFNKQYNMNRSADCHNILGISNRRIRNYEQAKNHYNSTLNLAISINDDVILKLAYHNLGYLNSTQGHSKQALDFFKKALDIDGKYILSIFLMAREYYALNDMENAQKWVKKGLNVLEEETNDTYFYHFKILEFKVDGQQSGEYEDLLKSKAIPYFEKTNQWDHVAEYANDLADYYFDNSQYKNAGLRYQQTIQAQKKFD